MSETLFYAAIIACLATLIVVMLGVIGVGTGKSSPSWSQRLMRFRIIAQFVAIILIMATILVAQSGG